MTRTPMRPLEDRYRYEEDEDRMDYPVSYRKSQNGSIVSVMMGEVPSYVYLVVSLYLIGVAHQLELGILGIFASIYANPQMYVPFYRSWERFWQRRRQNPQLILGALLALLAPFIGFSPAFAQGGGGGCAGTPTGLFSGAEKLLNKIASNTGSGANFCQINGIVINTMRALFVIYLIVGLVQVINAVRQGEEWKDVAKMPFLVLVVSILADTMIGFIAGNQT